MRLERTNVDAMDIRRGALMRNLVEAGAPLGQGTFVRTRRFQGIRRGFARPRNDRGNIMDSLLKGGVLWLLGVPILGVILLKLIGWI